VTNAFPDARRIRKFRQQLEGSPSVRTFADQIGISYVTLSNIETGKVGASRDMLEKIALGLRCDLHEIVDQKPRGGVQLLSVAGGVANARAAARLDRELLLDALKPGRVCCARRSGCSEIEAWQAVPRRQRALTRWRRRSAGAQLDGDGPRVEVRRRAAGRAARYQHGVQAPDRLQLRRGARSSAS
jgi:transcriptional regulator with XRE-family HTH domain